MQCLENTLTQSKNAMIFDFNQLYVDNKSLRTEHTVSELTISECDTGEIQY